MKLVVQIPCFNEVQSLRAVVETIPRTVPGVSTIDVIVIDDASTDGTGELAARLGVETVVRFQRHRGLAWAFRAGLEVALQRSADVIVNLDGDNQYVGADIGRLIAPILSGAADVVVGCRDIAHLAHFSQVKKILQRLGSGVVRLASGTDVPDAASGFRALSREAALRLVVLSNYTHTYDTLIHAGRQDLRVGWTLVRCNPPVRPSRLFRYMSAHIAVSAYTIVRSFLLYYPLRFFGTVAAALLASSALCFVGFISVSEQAKLSNFLLILGGVCLLLSVSALFFAFVSALSTLNRRLLEELLYRFKRERISGR